MSAQSDKRNRLVTVGEYQFDLEAEIARIALEAEGIRCTVVGGDLVANMPTIEPIRIELQVFDDDVPRAREVLSRPPAPDDDESLPEP